jgi:hypothetical protein
LWLSNAAGHNQTWRANDTPVVRVDPPSAVSALEDVPEPSSFLILCPILGVVFCLALLRSNIRNGNPIAVLEY